MRHTWTGCQSITRLTHRDKHLHLHSQENLKLPADLTCMSFECGRKPDYPEETPRSHGENMQTHTERFQPIGSFIIRAFLLWYDNPNHCTALSLYWKSITVNTVAVWITYIPVALKHYSESHKEKPEMLVLIDGTQPCMWLTVLILL